MIILIYILCSGPAENLSNPESDSDLFEMYYCYSSKRIRNSFFFNGIEKSTTEFQKFHNSVLRENTSCINRKSGDGQSKGIAKKTDRKRVKSVISVVIKYSLHNLQRGEFTYGDHYLQSPEQRDRLHLKKSSNGQKCIGRRELSYKNPGE